MQASQSLVCVFLFILTKKNWPRCGRSWQVCLHWTQFHVERSLTKPSELTNAEEDWPMPLALINPPATCKILVCSSPVCFSICFSQVNCRSRRLQKELIRSAGGTSFLCLLVKAADDWGLCGPTLNLTKTLKWLYNDYYTKDKIRQNF